MPSSTNSVPVYYFPIIPPTVIVPVFCHPGQFSGCEIKPQHYFDLQFSIDWFGTLLIIWNFFWKFHILGQFVYWEMIFAIRCTLSIIVCPKLYLKLYLLRTAVGLETHILTKATVWEVWYKEFFHILPTKLILILPYVLKNNFKYI